MFNLLMSELYENFVSKTKEIECFFVLSRTWDKEKILSPHEESNFRPADSEKKHLCLFLYRAQNLPSRVVISTTFTLSTLLIQAVFRTRVI